MRVLDVPSNPREYSSRIYLILGDFNPPDAVNTLIDPGVDGAVLAGLDGLNKGIGKRAVEQVILTHEHSDHTAGLPEVIRAFHPAVLGWKRIPGVTDTVHDGEWVRVGDHDAQILHTPGHSDDSICVYVPSVGALFTGDTPVAVHTPGGAWPRSLVATLERLRTLRLDVLYPGHAAEVRGNIKGLLDETLRNVRSSHLFDG